MNPIQHRTVGTLGYKKENEMLIWIQNVDNNIIGFVQTNLHNSIFDVMMPLFSFIGNNGAVWLIIAVIFLFFPKYRKYGIMIALGLFLTDLIGEVTLKPLIARVRPCNLNTNVLMLISRPVDFSFPSGHTSTSFSATIVIWRSNRKFGVFALLLAMLIAFSRLYLYVHYPTDLLAGAVLGMFCGAAAMGLIDLIIRKEASHCQKL
jgi:undecaprenyl-diphosphatase